MSTATKTFRRAIHVFCSDTGCYEFSGVHDQLFSDVISFDGSEHEWEIIEPLVGWSPWTHAIRVMYGDQSTYYFVR